jgi:hypothetical protein
MKNSLRRGLTLTALAGTCTIALAPAALAQATTSPQAIGVYATGVVGIPRTPNVTSGTTTVTSVNLGDLAVINALTGTVSGNTTTASIASITAGTGALGPIPAGELTAGAISSTCTVNANGSFTESSDIASLDILGHSFTPGTVTTPNDVILSTPVATVTLNAVATGPVTGSETVDAIHIVLDVLGVPFENIWLASSTCGPYSTPIPMASGKGLAIGLGVVGLFGAGLGTVYVRRRHGLAF